jgi:hypothetical protein
MRALKRGHTGADVRFWQNFLIGQEFYKGDADGVFGVKTEKATKLFQKMWRQVEDGIVGNKTYAMAMLLGFDGATTVEPADQRVHPNWPPDPRYPAQDQQKLEPPAEWWRKKRFGEFKYRHTPTRRNKEAVTILGKWYQENIVRVPIPQLKNIWGTAGRNTFSFHKKVAKQVTGMFDEWEERGLIYLIEGWSGSYCARFKRGSRTSLSNHAYGTAFDINYPWNRLGHIPALVGREGSVRELVPIANKWGFYWGGHFIRRPDGMHFECAKLL